MKKIVFLVLFIFTALSIHSQILEFDQLEMRYDQKQYRTVYKRASRLLDNPEYDFSYIPRYYLALSKFQLAQDKKWLRKNKFAIEEAAATIKEMAQTSEGRAVIRAHAYELSVLKNDLLLWMNVLQEDGDKTTFDRVNKVILELFPRVPDVTEMEEDHIEIDFTPDRSDRDVPQKDVSDDVLSTVNSISSPRSNIIDFSKSLLGTPYKWAGMTPAGFDCSGFTCYVYDQATDLKLSHRSGDQFKEAKRIKEKDVKPGDFIFFGTGSRINHVGLVYSTENNSIQMIHSSTSIGVSIIDIYESDYWKKRIKGFGTFLE